MLALTSPAPTNKVRSANHPRVRSTRMSQYWPHRATMSAAATVAAVTTSLSVETPGTSASARTRNGAAAQAASDPASRATLSVMRGR